MMTNSSRLLEEAYLSVSKKTANPEPTSAKKVGTEPNDTVEVGPMDEPAPGVDMNMIDSEVQDVEPEDKDTTGASLTMTAVSPENDFDLEQEDEEDQMVIDNLNSIRESIMKIASNCSAGGHLEIWAQQKLAIAMDNLAEVARRLH